MLLTHGIVKVRDVIAVIFALGKLSVGVLGKPMWQGKAGVLEEQSASRKPWSFWASKCEDEGQSVGTHPWSGEDESSSFQPPGETLAGADT